MIVGPRRWLGTRHNTDIHIDILRRHFFFFFFFIPFEDYRLSHTKKFQLIFSIFLFFQFFFFHSLCAFELASGFGLGPPSLDTGHRNHFTSFARRNDLWVDGKTWADAIQFTAMHAFCVSPLKIPKWRLNNHEKNHFQRDRVSILSKQKKKQFSPNSVCYACSLPNCWPRLAPVTQKNENKMFKV